MTKKNRKKVERILAFSYGVINLLQKPLPFFVAALIINILVASAIHLFWRDMLNIAPSSALQVSATVVESSSTVLAIFFALITFLLSRPSELRRAFKAGEFFSACFTFSLSIISSLVNMLFIEPDKRVDGTAIFVPAYLLIASLFLLFLFFYRLFRE